MKRTTIRSIKLGLVLVLGVSTLTATLNAVAADKKAKQKGREDFGSERIIDETPSELLPLDLVEETDSAPTPPPAAVAPVIAEPPKAVATREETLAEIAAVRLAEIPAKGDTPAGVKLTALSQTSPLVGVGLRDGDIIRSVNGAQLPSAQAFRDLLSQGIELGSAVLILERANQEVVVPLTFGRPNDTGSENNLDGSLQDSNQETTTILNVTDVDIGALVKTFSKLTKRNYIVDSGVKGNVTIHLPTAVTISESLRILDTVLLLKGFTTVPVGENTWKVVNAKDARQTTIPLIAGEEPNASDAMVTKLLRLKHIAAEDLQQLLGQFVSKDGVINAFDGTNSLIIIDSEQNIIRLERLVEELDVPAIDQDMTIIPVLHAEAKDLAEKINEILGEKAGEDAAAGRPGATNLQNNFNRGIRPASAVTNAATPQNTTAAGSNVKARSLGFKIIPDERTNSIIVVADQEMTLRVKALVEQLDSELDRSSGRFYVYRLQHADSEELAEILNSLLGTSGDTAGAGTAGTQGSSLSSRRTTSTATNNAETAQQQQVANQARLASALQRSRDLIGQRLAGTAPGVAEGRVNLEGEVSIAPDPATNSLVINASKGDYAKISEVIALLDTKRRQVLVEATILEVTLSDQQGLGIELQGTAALNDSGVIAQTNYGGLTNLLTNPAALTDLTIAAASTGTVTLPGGLTIPSQAVLVTAVSRLTNVNVLSAPTIMATDNQEAEIIVGENVPFVTSTSTDTANINNTFNTIERQDVGITLRITPQISSGDYVVLKIFVEISNVVASTRNDPNGPTTTIRTTETAVTVKDGQMIATGGLIQDSVSDTNRGVPFLKDIPVLGNLFERQDDTVQKTNLLIFITPKVIKDQFDARLVTKDATIPLQKHIDVYDLYPKRPDVLTSPAIDQVVEAYPVDPDSTPTPITPPAPTTVRPNGTTRTAADPGEVIELSVAPTLPGASVNPNPSSVGAPRGSMGATETEVDPTSVEPDFDETPEETSDLRSVESLGDVAAPEPTPSVAAGSAVVVLRPLTSGSPQITALKVTANDSNALQHFQVGQVYRDSVASGAVSYVCIGRYASLDEARTMHAGLQPSALRQLSPSELVGLGSKSWVGADAGSQ
jgi:general secretion pathway protein D